MTEFLLGLLLSILSVVAASGLLHAQWERARCAYLTYEAAHARLTGAATRLDPAIRVDEDGTAVRGYGTCDQAHEKVELPKLEPVAP
jgi:hypothetical protein